MSIPFDPTRGPVRRGNGMQLPPLPAQGRTLPGAVNMQGRVLRPLGAAQNVQDVATAAMRSSTGSNVPQASSSTDRAGGQVRFPPIAIRAPSAAGFWQQSGVDAEDSTTSPSCEEIDPRASASLPTQRPSPASQFVQEASTAGLEEPEAAASDSRPLPPPGAAPRQRSRRANLEQALALSALQTAMPQRPLTARERARRDLIGEVVQLVRGPTRRSEVSNFLGTPEERGLTLPDHLRSAWGGEDEGGEGEELGFQLQLPPGDD